MLSHVFIESLRSTFRIEKIAGINDFVASSIDTGATHISNQNITVAAASSIGTDAADTTQDADPVTEAKRSRKRTKPPAATPAYQTKE